MGLRTASVDKMPASTDKVQSVSGRRGTCQVEFLVLLSFRLDHGWGKQLPDFLSAGSSIQKVLGDALDPLHSVKICEPKSLPHPRAQYCSTQSLENPPVCALPYRVLYSSASINPQLWKLNHFFFFFFLELLP